MADHPLTPFNPADDPEMRDLEQRLHGLAGQVRFPPTPDLATATRRLVTQPSPTRLLAFRRTAGAGWWSRLAVAAALLVVVAATVLALVTPAREAVARWLDVPGIRLLIGEEEERPDESGTPLRSWLGEPMPLASLADEVAFTILVPPPAEFGDPDGAYLLIDADSGLPLVSLVYPPGTDVPAIPGSDAGLLIMQFAASPDSIWLEKQRGAETSVEVVRVNGAEALWIGGEHRLVLLPGTTATPGARTTANVLLWNHDGVTYRIEANLSQRAMIEIAESLQPVSP